VLTDLGGFERNAKEEARLLPAVARSLRHAASEGDFLAHLEGPVFAAILVDDRDRSTKEKADALMLALGSCIPLEKAASINPVVSLSGYEGELEVRDFLRRAQRDLVGARSRGAATAVPFSPTRAQAPQAA
jgi:GGDEF domain-containing protein